VVCAAGEAHTLWWQATTTMGTRIHYSLPILAAADMNGRAMIVMRFIEGSLSARVP
jgi:hypothetical protein